MVEVQITASAILDIKSLVDYVYDYSVQNAEKLYKEIIAKIRSLEQFPERGNIVKELQNPQFREIRLYHLRIIYRHIENTVQVLTVHHSARLLTNNPNLKDLL
jgi:toxin ParE1/3/4